jgi:hypothetical protein
LDSVSIATAAAAGTVSPAARAGPDAGADDGADHTDWADDDTGAGADATGAGADDGADAHPVTAAARTAADAASRVAREREMSLMPA